MKKLLITLGVLLAVLSAVIGCLTIQAVKELSKIDFEEAWK